MNIIITGATSLIGSALVEKYINEGNNVFAIVRPNSSNMKELPQSNLVTIIECDLIDMYKLDNIINQKCDVFFHLGWIGTSRAERDNLDIQYENISITLEAIKVAKKLNCKKFIATGSQAEYGPQSGVLAPDSQTNPQIAYGTCKLAAYYCAKQLSKQLEVDFIWIRVFSIFGPKDNKVTLITSMIHSLLKGEKPKLTKCEQIWDFLYVDDAAEALMLAEQKGVNGKVYCLGSGKATSLKNYVSTIYRYCNNHEQPIFGELTYEKTQVMHLEADISSFTKDTGFLPKYSFEEGIKKTIEWIREKGY